MKSVLPFLFRTPSTNSTPTSLNSFASKITLVTMLIIGISLYVRSSVGTTPMIADINGVGWLVGALATIYTFVAAFTIVEVWSQYNSASSLIAREGKAVTAIWNYVDYLDDKNVDKAMKTALLIYLKKAVSEMRDAAKGIRAIHPSPELKTIQHVVDGITFNDHRDAAVFPPLMNAYEELSSIRSERIESSITRLPALLKSFVLLLSTMLVIGFAFLGFVNTWFYAIAIGFVSIIVVYVYTLMNDLDNPYEGIWNVSFEAFEQAEKYITGTKHQS